jgi:NAD(P)H-quinone oxidoreductase subunit 2
MWDGVMVFLNACFNFPVFNWLAEQNVPLISPELCLVSTALFSLFKGVTRQQQDAWLYSVFGLVFAIVCVISQYSLLFTWEFIPEQWSLGANNLMIDGLSWTIRLLLLVGTLFTVLLSRQYVKQRSDSPAEFYTVLMFSLTGAMLLTAANNLIMLFVALETMGIASYVLAGYFRNNVRNVEAALKYITYGGVSSALLLFGFSLLYGLSGGQTDLFLIGKALHVGVPALGGATWAGAPIMALAAVMVLAGLGFKLSLAPFHQWTPDVYQGAPTPVSAYLSVVSKGAAFAVVIRLIQTVFVGIPGLTETLMVMAALSIVWGNVAAALQTDIKRLIGFSTIAQAGYMALGLLVAMPHTLSTLVFYLAGYLFTNMGAFAAVTAFEMEVGSTKIADLAGIVSKRPAHVLAFSLFLLSLAGLPITVGFFSKFFLFQSVVAQQPALMGLIILALLASVVSLYYYVNVIRVMVVDAPAEAVRYLKPITLKLPSGVAVVLATCAVTVVGLGVFSSASIDWLNTNVFQRSHQSEQSTAVFNRSPIIRPQHGFSHSLSRRLMAPSRAAVPSGFPH